MAVATWALTVLLALGALVLLVAGSGQGGQDDLFGGVGGLASVAYALAFATVGAIVRARLPANRLGPILALTGLLSAASQLAYSYASHALHASDEPPRAAAWAALAGIGSSEALAAALGLVLLLFPDGRAASRRWRPAVAAAWLGAGLLLVSGTLAPGSFEPPFEEAANPLGAEGWGGVLEGLNLAGWLLATASMALGAAALLHRLRRAGDVERRQLRLVLAVGAAVAVVVAVAMASWFVWPDGPEQARMALIGGALTLFAVAVGVSILRYRLYELDVVVDRTLVYAALTLALGAAYAATAVLLGTALGRGAALTTAGATLTAALVFRPLRGRLQDAVDRRFHRSRYDALRRMAAFEEELRAGRAAPEEVEALLRELTGDPSLSLRLRLPGSDALVDVDGHPAAQEDERPCTAIERGGTSLGAVVHRDGGPERAQLLAALLDAGALAIEMARLRIELRRRLAEVEASRARIVTATLQERRRIERDLHDGAQQRLLGVGLALRHAQHRLAVDPPERTAAALDRAVGELTGAIAELRELALGLPPAQLDAGLGPALHELAGRAPMPVSIDAPGDRLPHGVEAAAYFIACEGLTNAVKHASASHVAIRAARSDTRLVLSIADDGVGGVAPERGSGLRGLADRIAAHGGRFAIESEPGRGTTLVAELPCAS